MSECAVHAIITLTMRTTSIFPRVIAYKSIYAFSVLHPNAAGPIMVSPCELKHSSYQGIRCVWMAEASKSRC